MNRQQLFNYSIRAATSSVRLRLANWSSAIRSRLFTSLGLLQLATLCALVILIMLSILVLRHASDDYFVPLVEHLQSLKIAFPPIVAFFCYLSDRVRWRYRVSRRSQNHSLVFTQQIL